MADINKYTAKEALNKVIYNNASINTYALSEGLNTVLDDANDRLNIRLEGGTVDGDLTITGGLTVEGATTVIESTTLSIDDKNIDLASTDTPSDATADGGGITLKGTSDKTILWDNTNDNWTFNQAVNIATGLDYKINNTSVLNATTLGSGVTASSLTSVGTLTGLSVASSNQVPLNSYSSGSNSYLVTQVQESQNNVAGIAFSVGNTAISSTASANSHALIQGIVTTNSDSALTGELAFWTNGGDSNAEAMRIDSSGNVGIGCDPTTKFEVDTGAGSGNNVMIGQSSATNYNCISLNGSVTNTASQGLLGGADGGDLYIDTAGTTPSIYFRIGGATHMAIKNGGNVYLGNASSNANMAGGITIGQSGGNNEIISLKSNLTAHGMTSVSETNTYGFLNILNTDDGGLQMVGMADTGTIGLYLQSSSPTDDTTRTTSSLGKIRLQARKNASTSWGACGTDCNLVSIQNSGTTRFLFDAEGSGHADVEWTTFSDSRLKLNQEQIPYGLNEINQLQPKIYDRHSGDVQNGEVTLEETSRRQIGFIAQEVKEIIPELVKDVDESHSFYSMDDGKIVAVLVKAVQELSAKVTALENA